MSRPAPVWEFDLDDEGATSALAERVAPWLRADDLVTLSGDLGAGKTAFARALIRALTGDPALEAPSPTFTLMQVYDGPAFPIVHADLYRVQRPEELIDLGWEEASDRALVLVEWPERGGDNLSHDRLDIAIGFDADRGPDFRHATLTGHGAFAPRLEHARALAGVLEASGWADATRTFMLGDASVRAYEKLEKPDGGAAILMTQPPRPDGPILRYGKPYAAIARLSEDIRAFIAMAEALHAQGYSAPRIYSYDIPAGLAVIEDLGNEFIANQYGPILDRTGEAVALLADLHTRALPRQAPVDGGKYTIPTYDCDAMLIEVELLLEWYAPHVARASVASGARAIFLSLWRAALQPILDQPTTWTLRDFHSPNLLWLSERSGLARVGLIDFQDCVMGPPAYDLASLLQDARVDVPGSLEMRMIAQYARARTIADPNFDATAFAASYAAMGAQRATKILGLFARLDKRDGKPQYLAHIPRFRRYLTKSLAHPVLSPIKLWYEANLPGVLIPE